jgi:hypothetical protein
VRGKGRGILLRGRDENRFTALYEGRVRDYGRSLPLSGGGANRFMASAVAEQHGMRATVRGRPTQRLGQPTRRMKSHCHGCAPRSGHRNTTPLPPPPCAVHAEAVRTPVRQRPDEGRLPFCTINSWSCRNSPCKRKRVRRNYLAALVQATAATSTTPYGRTAATPRCVRKVPQSLMQPSVQPSAQ